jgi:hypothetical protein
MELSQQKTLPVQQQAEQLFTTGQIIRHPSALQQVVPATSDLLPESTQALHR